MNKFIKFISWLTEPIEQIRPIELMKQAAGLQIQPMEQVAFPWTAEPLNPEPLNPEPLNPEPNDWNLYDGNQLDEDIG